jgi:hypothetical protein
MILSATPAVQDDPQEPEPIRRVDFFFDRAGIINQKGGERPPFSVGSSPIMFVTVPGEWYIHIRKKDWGMRGLMANTRQRWQRLLVTLLVAVVLHPSRGGHTTQNEDQAGRKPSRDPAAALNERLGAKIPTSCSVTKRQANPPRLPLLPTIILPVLQLQQRL